MPQGKSSGSRRIQEEIMKPKKAKKKLSPKQRANQLEREYYRGAIKEGQPKWQDVWKEIYG